MRAVMLEVPEHFLQERRRLGHDRWDEMWEGVLHMVPPANGPHQFLEAELLAAFREPAKAKGLIGTPETGTFRPGTQPPDWDYRMPDLVYARPDAWSQRGVEGRAQVVFEIRSPGDESYEKLPFYFSVGCFEVVILDRDSLAIELFRDGEAVPAEADGSFRLESLDVTLRTVDGPAVVVTWRGAETVVQPLRPAT